MPIYSRKVPDESRLVSMKGIERFERLFCKENKESPLVHTKSPTKFLKFRKSGPTVSYQRVPIKKGVYTILQKTLFHAMHDGIMPLSNE